MLNLITDRTNADVSYAQSIKGKKWANLTSEQKAVRNQKLHTYKNITNISLSDELASIDVEYKRDLETMFNNKIKQIPSSTSHTTET